MLSTFATLFLLFCFFFVCSRHCLCVFIHLTLSQPISAYRWIKSVVLHAPLNSALAVHCALCLCTTSSAFLTFCCLCLSAMWIVLCVRADVERTMEKKTFFMSVCIKELYFIVSIRIHKHYDYAKKNRCKIVDTYYLIRFEKDGFFPSVHIHRDTDFGLQI